MFAFRRLFSVTYLFIFRLTPFFPGAVWAVADEPARSVHSLVAEVLGANPELAIYDAEIEAARGERRQAARWSNPEFSLEAGRQRVNRAGGVGAAEGLAWAASVAQPIEFPGRIALRKAIADANLELAELGRSQFRRVLANRVQVLAHRLHAARTRADAAEAVADRARELTEVVLQRETAGISPLLESRVLESSRLILEHRRMGAWHTYQGALIELNQLRDLPAETPVRIEEVVLDLPDLPPLRELVESAWKHSFEARSRRLELEQQGFRVDLAENERYPTVTVAPFVSQDRAGERETVVGLGVSFPLPLWDRGSGSLQSARARERQAEAALRLMRREVERNVVEHALAFEAASGALRSLRHSAIDDLAAAGSLADEHFRQGALSVSLYLEVQTAYLDALDALLTMRQEALESRLEVELATGRTLESKQTHE